LIAPRLAGGANLQSVAELYLTLFGRVSVLRPIPIGTGAAWEAPVPETDIRVQP